ncbi:MAG: hypothetical protein M1830_001147 [Pleopsidium flavum]|nr:MAG: hypothetical protein M1830_001147 [Pleopsidium flavum]
MVERRAKRSKEKGKSNGGEGSKQGATTVGMYTTEGDLLPSRTGDKSAATFAHTGTVTDLIKGFGTNPGPNGTQNVTAPNIDAPTNANIPPNDGSNTNAPTTQYIAPDEGNNTHGQTNGNLTPDDGNNDNAPTKQTIIPNDGNNTNASTMQIVVPTDSKDTIAPGQQVPLTASNLAQLNPRKEKYVQPPATIDERLAQARNFLSDEDVNLCKEFTEFHQLVDDLLRALSEERQQCDVNLYNQVQDMMRVHQRRMNKLKYPLAEQVKPGLLRPYSSRLPSNDPTAMAQARLAFRKEDHAPFTIDRKPDHARFVRPFRTIDDTGRNLRKIESDAYYQTLLEPGLVNAYVEENSFEQRALKRGRRRAALQKALRAFADNREQHFKGGWMHRVVSLPQPPAATFNEPQMSQSALESERPAEPEAFEWTKKNLAFQQGQKQLEQWVNTERAQIQGNIITSDDKNMFSPEPAVFYKPTQRRGVVKARQERRLFRLARMAFAILAQTSSYHVSRATGKEAPSAPEAQVMITALSEGLIDDTMEEIEDVPTANQIMVIQQYAKSGGQLLQRGSDGGGDEAALSDSELARLDACYEEGLAEPNEEIAGLLRRLGTEFFGLIEQANDVGWENNNPMTKDEDKQALVNFREDLARDTSTTTTARKFFSLRELAQPLNGTDASLDVGEAKNLLTDRILIEHNEDLCSRRLQHDKIWSFTSKLPTRSKAQNFFSLEKWSAPPPFAPETVTQEKEGTTGASTARGTGLQQKRPRNEITAAQTTKGKRKATSDPESVPALKRSQNAVDYRSLDPTDETPSRRLAPEEIGFQVVKEKSHEPVPEVGSGMLMPAEIKEFNMKKHGQVLENAPDPVEKRLKGPPKFPFGETSTTSAALNTQIRLHLGDATAVKDAREANSKALQLFRPRTREVQVRDIILAKARNDRFLLPAPAQRINTNVYRQADVFTQAASSESNFDWWNPQAPLIAVGKQKRKRDDDSESADDSWYEDGPKQKRERVDDAAKGVSAVVDTTMSGALPAPMAA